MTVLGLTEAVRPDGEADVEREIVPEKLLRLETAIAEVAEKPDVKLRDAGLAVIAKSGEVLPLTVTVMVAEWDLELLVPVTTMVKLPGVVELTVRVDVPDPPEISVMLPGLREAVGPDGETAADSETVPAKPLRLCSAIVDVAEEPAVKLSDVGLAAMVKSEEAVTVIPTFTEWDKDPLVPVTVTV